MGCVGSIILRATLEELVAAVEAATTAEPLPPEGEFAETWTGGDGFHWSGKAKAPIPAGSARHAAEVRCMQAVMELDKAQLAAHEASVKRAKSMSTYHAVKVAWLKEFAAKVPRDWTTAMVVERIIKPATADRRCRFVETLTDPGSTGAATLFGSHTWAASFVDLVAAITCARACMRGPCMP